MGRWLDQVRVDALKPPGEVPTKPTKAPSVGSVSTLGGVFQQNRRSDGRSGEANCSGQASPTTARLGTEAPPQETAQTPPGVHALRQAIVQALDWHDLETAIVKVQAAFEAGEVSQEQAEGLAAMAAQEAQVLPDVDVGERLSALLRRQPSVRVDSKILGEWVLWAADGAPVPADNTLVVYRESELRQMAGRSPEELRAIHAVKRSLDGEVLPGYGGLPRAAAERRTSSSVRAGGPPARPGAAAVTALEVRPRRDGYHPSRFCVNTFSNVGSQVLASTIPLYRNNPQKAALC